jgi:DNA topoisomerase-6 subunit A
MGKKSEERRKEVVEKLTELGKEIAEQVIHQEPPHIKIPVRSLSNIEFDEQAQKLYLGNKVAKRSFINVSHTRKFMQTLLVAAFAKGLVSQNLHTSLRDMYYAIKRTIPGTKENTFEEQLESDAVVVDLEVAEDILREEMHLNADVRGRVVGDVTIIDRGDEVDWSRLGSGGWAIPSNVEDIEFKEVNADYILVVEKNAAFERMHEDKYWKKENLILVTTQGQAARGVRRLINRLAFEHNLPVIVFTDADAYGWYIYSVIKWGSMNLAHVTDKLGTPQAKFVGLTISDIDKYHLEKYTIKAKDVDIKRAKELLQYPWFQRKEWQEELQLMIKKGYKAELEALSGKGLQFMTKTYLPEKIENKEFLP